VSRVLHPRCGTDTCVRCRKKFEPGDRATVVNIVDRVGVNPDNIRQQGAWLTGEFELLHVDCKNPGLDNSISLREHT
jgi:hypothetical protein